MKTLVKSMQQHSLWDAVHIAAYMGTIAYFERKQKQNADELVKLLDTAAQPERNYALHIACEANQFELVITKQF
jgi:hypothetical protein